MPRLPLETSPASQSGLSRRSALLGAALLPFAATSLGAAAPVQAATPQKETAAPTHYRFMLGKFDVTVLLAGTNLLEEPQKTFGMTTPPETFTEISRAAFIPHDKSLTFYTPVLVNTGDERILFDTGTSPAAITAVLESAGYKAEHITKVVLTHMHGDHIGGLSTGTTNTFSNATYVTGAIEYNYWAKTGNPAFEEKVRPLHEKFTFIKDGDQAASGITAMLAAGHTPGHMIYILESEGKKLVLVADTANHYIWSLENPDWEVRFDMNKVEAAETRKKVFGMLAAERLPFIGYHMPFPGLGYVEPRGNGFRYVAASYQQML